MDENEKHSKSAKRKMNKEGEERIDFAIFFSHLCVIVSFIYALPSDTSLKFIDRKIQTHGTYAHIV